MHISGRAIRLAVALGFPALVGAQTGFKYWNPLDSTHVVPPTLSATGLYTDITSVNKKLLANAYVFDVNSPLWSDNAKKKRWVMLKPGSKPIVFEEKNDYWAYPDSTVFIKQFAIDTVPGIATSRVLWETRILIVKKQPLDTATGRINDAWYGYTYKWNAAQTDAVLVPTKGQDDSIRIYPEGLGKPSAMKKWRFPSRNQCSQCHRIGSRDTTHGRTVLGFFAAQLNRQHPDTNANQIEYLFKKNVLGGVKPTNYATVPKWYAIEDSTATLDQRARSYIAANCSGCHGFRGMETDATNGINLNYDYHTVANGIEFRHKTTQWGYNLEFTAPFYYPKNDANNPEAMDSLEIKPALVVPGYPNKSVILWRQLQRNIIPGDYNTADYQMPPIAVFEPDVNATNLLTKWITEMPKLPAPGYNSAIHRANGARINLKGPAFQGRQIVIPADMSEFGRARVSMTSLTGRSVGLTRTSLTTFAIPASAPRGVYIIKVGDSSFKRNLF